jgi:hypothetical protein
MPAAPSKQRKIAIVGSRSVGMSKVLSHVWVLVGCFFLLGGAAEGVRACVGCLVGVTCGYRVRSGCTRCCFIV